MNQNPYITKINSQIVKKISSHGKIHLALKNSVHLDYKKHNSFEESLYINGHPVEKTYDSSLGKVYITARNPQESSVDLSVDYNQRMEILRSFTSRYLIISALNKYYGLEAMTFRTEKDYSSFFIKWLEDDNLIKNIIMTLHRVIEIYIKAGLDIKNEYEEINQICKIDGIYRGRKFSPHLSNTAEIGKFSILHYEKTNSGITLFYKN